MDSRSFLFGSSKERNSLNKFQKQDLKTKTFEYEENYSDSSSDSSEDFSPKNVKSKNEESLSDYFGMDFFKDFKENSTQRNNFDSRQGQNYNEDNNFEHKEKTKNEPFGGVFRFKTYEKPTEESMGNYKTEPSNDLSHDRKPVKTSNDSVSESLESKIPEFIYKKIRAKYCCIFCNTKNEVNFRPGRYSECKACESRKQLYRRSLKLKSSEEKGYQGPRNGIDISEGNKSSDENFKGFKPLLLCHNCYLENKPCEVCTLIQGHVQTKKLSKSKAYLCLTCGTNIKERFVEGIYSRCRACKNEIACQKYELEKKKDEGNENSINDQKSVYKNFIRTIPDRVTNLEKFVFDLQKEKNAELEELHLDILTLKETHHDEILELKEQIKQLKFLISRN
jgi:ribosomal protein L37AE/L43A